MRPLYKVNEFHVVIIIILSYGGLFAIFSSYNTRFMHVLLKVFLKTLVLAYLPCSLLFTLVAVH
jgi:hypothetical protein